MMTKKKYFIIKIIVIIIILQLMILPTISQGAIWWDIYTQARNWLIKGSQSSAIDSDSLNEASSNIFNVLVGIGVVLSVVIGGILGIQFMMASAEDKAKIKEAFIPYILGCVIIFGAFGIWRLVVNVLQSIAV